MKKSERLRRIRSIDHDRLITGDFDVNHPTFANFLKTSVQVAGQDLSDIALDNRFFASVCPRLRKSPEHSRSGQPPPPRLTLPCTIHAGKIGC